MGWHLSNYEPIRCPQSVTRAPRTSGALSPSRAPAQAIRSRPHNQRVRLDDRRPIPYACIRCPGSDTTIS